MLNLNTLKVYGMASRKLGEKQLKTIFLRMLNPQVRFVSPCLGVRRSPLLCCYKYPKKKRISLDHNKRYKSIIVKKLRKKVDIYVHVSLCCVRYI